MKTKNKYLSLALLSWVLALVCWLLMGCAGHNYHRLDCKYRALTAAHAAEMNWNVKAYVATDRDHAQAFYLDNHKKVWLAARNGCVVRYAPREVADRISVWSLEHWDRLLRIEN